ncbi:MAG: hypothetical protein U5K37_11930 [Natrialbaceae archaeon]|nr:hypothetical protein [Natrialbaceae archaeon]
MRRRTFLAGASAMLAVGLAGCGHPDVVLDFEPATDEAIADRVSQRVQSGDPEHRVVTAAIENGTAQRQGRYALFEPNETVRIEIVLPRLRDRALAGRRGDRLRGHARSRPGRYDT